MRRLFGAMLVAVCLLLGASAPVFAAHTAWISDTDAHLAPSFSGDLDSDLPVMMRSSSGSRWNSRSNSVNSSGSADTTLRFHTFSGSVRITK